MPRLLASYAYIYTDSPTHQEFWGHFFDDYPNYHATEQRSNFKFTCRCWTISLLNSQIVWLATYYLRILALLKHLDGYGAVI